MQHFLRLLDEARSIARLARAEWAAIRSRDGVGYLLLAGLSEIGWAVGLKYTAGFSRLVPSVLTLACMGVSIGLLGLALKTLPLGTAYAIWTGIGTIGTAIWASSSPRERRPDAAAVHRPDHRRNRRAEAGLDGIAYSPRRFICGSG
jgi:multidrug transporter EmrE-like cation transporter